jgi:DNA-3-methyladenine glycosylase
MRRPLPRSFYARDTRAVARELLGAILARRAGGRVLRGRIVEAEAYLGEHDLACHARAGRTQRTDPLYGPPGTAYVYFTYGMHHCLNAVTQPEGTPAAVLIRALEPLEGLEAMARARGIEAPHLLASGPARLCQALGIDLSQNRADLRGPDLWIEPGEEVPDHLVLVSPRIGCERAPAPWAAKPLRFYVAGSPHVSPGRASARPQRRAGPEPSRGARRKQGDNAAPHRE